MSKFAKAQRQADHDAALGVNGAAPVERRRRVPASNPMFERSRGPQPPDD